MQDKLDEKPIDSKNATTRSQKDKEKIDEFIVSNLGGFDVMDVTLTQCLLTGSSQSSTVPVVSGAEISDMIEDIMAAKETGPAKCDEGHTLTWSVNCGNECDMCRETGTYWRCAECDYDLCGECNKDNV